MRPALCQRQLVVYLLHWPQHPPSSGTPHRTSALQRSGHGYVSMPCHTYGVQPGCGRTSRSGGSPVFHAPHRTVPLSASDSRGRNTASSVSLASASPPLDIKKAPAGFQCSREGPLDIFSRYQHTTPRRINHLTKWTSWFPEQQGSQFCQRPILPPVCGCPLNPEVVRHVLRRAAAVFIVLAVERIQHWIYVNTLDKKS